MPTRWLHLGIFAGLLSVASLGCASGTATDIARIRALTNMPLPSDLGPIDEPLAPEVAALLAEPLDLDTAVRVALANNRPLRASLRELGIERGMLIDARSVANPTVEIELLPERNTELELRVEYAISDLILAPLRSKVARFELDAARYRTAAEVVRLGYQVRAGYRRFQAAQERLALGQRWLDAQAAGRDAAVALEEAGSINALEAASRIVGYERARLSVAELELELASCREALQRLLGLHGEDAGWTITGALPALPSEVPNVAKLETAALEANLELAADRSKLEALAHTTGLERTEGWLPEIEVDYHALVGNPQAPANDPDQGWRSGAGISLAVPLFNQNRGKVRAAEAEFDGAHERYLGQTIDLRSRSRELGNELRATHGAARHLIGVVLPAQRRVLDETSLQYNAMQIGVFELLAAEQGLLEAELGELEARANYWVTAAAYEAALAGATPELDLSGAATGPQSNTAAEGGH